MALDVMSMIARLGIDKTEYEKGMQEAEGGFKGFGSKLKAGVANVAKIAAGAAAAGAAAFTAVTAAVTKGVSEVAAFGDNIDKASQKLGISAKAYQEWDAVLQHSGASIDSLGIGMKTLSSKAAEGSDAFKKLGISQKDAAKMSREELFSRTITALQGVKDANKKAQLAQELFGRSAMELGPLLNTTAEDTQAMKDQVNALGGVLSDEAVKASAAYQDALQDMNTAMDGMKRGLFASFLPSMTQVMQGITDVFTGKGTANIRKGIRAFIDGLGKTLPTMLKRGLNIASAIGGAVISAVPDVISRVTKALPKVWNGIKAYVSVTLFPALSKLIASVLGRGNTSMMGERLTGTFRSIFDKVISVVEGIGAKVGEFWTKVLQPILGDIVEFVLFYVLPLADQLLEAISPALEWLGGVVSTVFQTIANLWNGTLMPVIMDIYYWIVNTLIPAVTEKWKEWSPVVKDVFDKIKAFWEDPLKPALDELYKKVVEEIIPAVKEKFEEWAPVVQAVFQKIVDVWNDPLKPTFQKLFAWAAETLPGAFNTLKDVFDKVWEFVSTTFAPVFDTLKGALMGDEEATTKLKDAMVAILPWITGAAAAFVAYKTAVAIGSIIDAVTKSTAGLSVAQAILNAVMNANPFVLIASLLAGVAAALVTAYETNDDFRNKVDTAWKDIKQWASDTFEPVVKWFKDVGDTLDNLWHTYMEPVCNWVTDTFVGAWESLKTGLSDLVDFISKVFSGDWGKAWDALVAMVKTPFDTLGEILKTPINAVIGLINSMLKKVESAINKVINGINNKLNIDLTWNVPDWMGGGQLGWQWSPNLKTVNWKTIPLLANGGIVGNGGEAIVGEYRPEHLRVVNGKAVVTPLNTGRFPGGQEMVEPRTQTPRMLNVTLKIRDTEIARVLLPLLEAEEQRVGVKLSKGGAY